MSGGNSGFTLLEVLIALAILSAVSLVALRAVGDGMVLVADNGWKDQASRLGRAQMLRLVQQGLKGNMQGSFAPDFPDMSWRATVASMGDMPGRKVEFLVRQERGNHELLLEQIIFP